MFHDFNFQEFLFCYDLLDGKVMQMRTPYGMLLQLPYDFWMEIIFISLT